MKRLLALLALCLTLAAPVLATPLTFQNEHDITDVTMINTYGTCQPSNDFPRRSTTAGNQYIYLQDSCAVQNKNAVPFTYAAWSSFTAGYLDTVYLGDASNNTIATLNIPNYMGYPFRTEVVISGGTAKVYQDGILQGTSGTLSTNPSYVRLYDHYGGTGNPSFDDFILGSSDSKYVVGMPASNGYFIKKDMVNPSASGVYNYSTGALVNSNYMYTTWGRSNVSAVGGSNVNESMYLINVDTHTVYETHYTGNATAGTTTWNIATSLIAANAPYGRYQVKFGDFYSDEIAYIANGASISFDQSSYNQQDTATITYLIDGAYWDTSTFAYSMKVYSANDWSVVSNQPLTASSGVLTYQFTSNDPQGEYYAVIVAAPNVGGSDIWLNYDYAALTAYAAFSGYVNDAETTLPISGANVSFSQNGIVSNSITTVDGNYTANGFMTGTPLVINTTATGYYQYYVSFTPSTHGSKTVNITLNSTTPTHTGLAIGGIARDGILTGTLITSGYGRPIEGATVHIWNTSTGEYYNKTTNMAGWYLCDEGEACYLSSGVVYDVWGEKLGSDESQNYSVVP